MTKIAVFGAGTWGIALARLLAANGRDVTVWSAIPAELKSLSTTHRHPNLPGMELPAAMHYTADIAEACAIRAVFGDLPVTVSSTKGATGHMMGAGGLTEVITCVQAIRTGLLPPSLGLTEQDPECPLHLTGPTAVQQPVHAAISNAMGFGGQNSCIVVGRYQE